MVYFLCEVFSSFRIFRIDDFDEVFFMLDEIFIDNGSIIVEELDF